MAEEAVATLPAFSTGSASLAMLVFPLSEYVRAFVLNRPCDVFGETFVLFHFFVGYRPRSAPAARWQARKGRADGRLRHENGYQVALAPCGELGASWA